MTLVRRQRLAKPTRRWDPTELREALADGKVHVSLAVVIQEGASHFEVTEGADVLVEVELQPSGIRTSARLGGMGFYKIPPVGAEVAVLVPDGELELGPVIVQQTGEAPDGLSPTALVVVAPAGGHVLVHDGTASQALPLATKADLDQLRAAIAAWTPVPNDGGAALRTALVNAGIIPGSPGSPPTPVASWPAGTTVLGAK